VGIIFSVVLVFPVASTTVPAWRALRGAVWLPIGVAGVGIIFSVVLAFPVASLTVPASRALRGAAWKLHGGAVALEGR